jgi:hypothetical protein
MADFQIQVSSDDSRLLRRLLHDSFWNPVPEVTNGTLSLSYSTRRIGKRPAGVSYVEYDDLKAYLPGEAPVDFAAAAKHFILLGHQLKNLPEMPPNIELKMRIPVRFSTAFADAHHNRGFHVKHIAAATFAAQVEHYQLQIGQSPKEKVCDLVTEANEYLACALAVQQKIVGFEADGIAEELRKMESWVRKTLVILNDIKASAGCASP